MVRIYRGRVLRIFILAAAGAATTGCAELDEISVYQVRCQGGVGPARCELEQRITFGVSATQQLVLEWLPEMASAPVRHTGCVVRSASHWTCYDTVGVVRREMSRGIYSESRLRDPVERRFGDPTVYYLSTWQKWKWRLGYFDLANASRN